MSFLARSREEGFYRGWQGLGGARYARGQEAGLVAGLGAGAAAGATELQEEEEEARAPVAMTPLLAEPDGLARPVAPGVATVPVQPASPPELYCSTHSTPSTDPHTANY
jgi:hypothetical protein